MTKDERYAFEEIQRARRAIFECPHCAEQKERIARVVRRDVSHVMIRKEDGKFHSLPPAWQQIPAEDVVQAMQEYLDKWGPTDYSEQRGANDLKNHIHEWLQKKVLEMSL
jgi:aspartate/methionine/tyrosine aminotransferase